MGLFCLTALACLCSSPLRPQDTGLVFDVEATEVRFTLGATLHTVAGSARLAVGELSLDLERRIVSGAVVVDATSADTGNPKRDRKMHREVLRSEAYPQIVLRPRSWEGELDLTSPSTVTVRGGLVLLGQEHEIELPVRIRPEAEGAVVELEVEIPYVDWGLADPSTFILRVAKSVRVEVEARATLAATPPLQ